MPAIYIKADMGEGSGGGRNWDIGGWKCDWQRDNAMDIVWLKFMNNFVTVYFMVTQSKN